MTLYYPKCPHCGSSNVTVCAKIRANNVVLGHEHGNTWFDEHDVTTETITMLICYDCEHSGKDVKPWLTDEKEKAQ
jgi:hypothetical protein